MRKVKRQSGRARPALQTVLLDGPKADPYPAWVWPFVKAYERHRGVASVKQIYDSVFAIRRLLRPGENLFDVFAVWLYFLRDLDIPAHRPQPSVRGFAADYRVYWSAAWNPAGAPSELGGPFSPARRKYVIRWLLQEEEGDPWQYEALLRAFRDGVTRA